MTSAGLAAGLGLAGGPDSSGMRTERSFVRLFGAAEDTVTFAEPSFGPPLLGQLLGPLSSCFARCLVCHFRSVPESICHNASTSTAIPWPPPIHAEPIP